MLGVNNKVHEVLSDRDSQKSLISTNTGTTSGPGQNRIEGRLAKDVVLPESVTQPLKICKI